MGLGRCQSLPEKEERMYSLREAIKELRMEQLIKKIQQLEEESDKDNFEGWLVDQGLDSPFDHEELAPLEERKYIRRKERQLNRRLIDAGIDRESLKNDAGNYELSEVQKEDVKRLLAAADHVCSPKKHEERREKLRKLRKEIEEKMHERNREDISREREEKLSREIDEKKHEKEKLKAKMSFEAEKFREELQGQLFQSLDPDSDPEKLVEKVSWIGGITAKRVRHHRSKNRRDPLKLKLGPYILGPSRNLDYRENKRGDLSELLEEFEERFGFSLKQGGDFKKIAKSLPEKSGDPPERGELLALVERLKEVNEDYLKS